MKREKAIEAHERRKNNPLVLERQEEWRRNQKKENPRRYTAQQMRGSAKKRANALGVDYNLDSKYIESLMQDFCPILGFKVKYGGGEKTKFSASLDRVVPSRGYVKGNVMVVSLLANLMKNEASPEEMLHFAAWVLETYQHPTNSSA